MQRQAQVLVSNAQSYTPMSSTIKAQSSKGARTCSSSSITQAQSSHGQNKLPVLPSRTLPPSKCILCHGMGCKAPHSLPGQLYLHNMGCYEEKSGLCKLSFTQLLPSDIIPKYELLKYCFCSVWTNSHVNVLLWISNSLCNTWQK